MEDRLAALEKRIAFYDRLIYAIAAVAVVFGIGGGVGLALFNEMKKELDDAELILQSLIDRIEYAEQRAIEIDREIDKRKDDIVSDIISEAVRTFPVNVIERTLENGVDTIKARNFKIVDNNDIVGLSTSFTNSGEIFLIMRSLKDRDSALVASFYSNTHGPFLKFEKEDKNSLFDFHDARISR